MKRKILNKTKLIILLLVVFILFVGCNSKANRLVKLDNPPQLDDNGLQDTHIVYSDLLLHKLYETSDSSYTIYTSNLLDTYIIASALKLEFESNNLLPNKEQNQLFIKAEEHFLPYKDHEFIKDLDKYTDFQYKDVNGAVIQPIIMYLLSNAIYGVEVNQVQSYLFDNGEEFVEFINGLNKFYLDTNAESFFKENEADYLNMVKYLQENIKDTPVESIINTMENYVSNKDLYFANQNVHYVSIITLYRPFLASFYTIQMGNEIYLVSQQSLVGADRNISNFDITQSVESAIHEFLHMYINIPVNNQMELIEQLTTDKKKAEYAGDIYQNMDWGRIVDENIVRAITARIYAIEYKDDERAFNQVLQKEITMGGFTKVDRLFESLKLYENNRIDYKSVDMYISQLINIMFE